MVTLELVVQDLVQYAIEHRQQTGGAAAVIIGSLFSYQRTGRLPVGRLPWHYFRRLLRDLTDKYFGVARPRGVPGVVVDAPPQAVKRALRDRHYESVDLYSYEYEDEAWGLRRPSGARPHPMTGEPAPTETHPRGFRTENDECLIICHDEASRLERTGDHLAETMLTWELGRDVLAEDLQAVQLAYESVASERAAGVTIVPPEG